MFFDIPKLQNVTKKPLLFLPKIWQIVGVFLVQFKVEGYVCDHIPNMKYNEKTKEK